MKVFTVSYNNKAVCEVSSPEQAITLIRLMDSVIHLSELAFTVRITDTGEENHSERSEVITLSAWDSAVTVTDRLCTAYPEYRRVFQSVAVQCSPEMARALVAAHPLAFDTEEEQE